MSRHDEAATCTLEEEEVGAAWRHLQSEKSRLEEEIGMLETRAQKLTALLESAAEESQASWSRITATKMDGSAVECTVDLRSSVTDLKAALERESDGEIALVDSKPGTWGHVLITEGGVEMLDSEMLADYDLGAEARVTVLARWHMCGCYRCWVPVDQSNLFNIVHAKFTLEIADKLVSINGVGGKTTWDDNQCKVELLQPTTLRPSDRSSRASLRVERCSFTFQVIRDGANIDHAWPVCGELYAIEGSSGKRTVARFRGKA